MNYLFLCLCFQNNRSFLHAGSYSFISANSRFKRTSTWRSSFSVKTDDILFMPSLYRLILRSSRPLSVNFRLRSLDLGWSLTLAIKPSFSIAAACRETTSILRSTALAMVDSLALGPRASISRKICIWRGVMPCSLSSLPRIKAILCCRSAIKSQTSKFSSNKVCFSTSTPGNYNIKIIYPFP